MIVPFAVQPDALRTEISDSAWELAFHEALIDCWRKYGVLVEPDAKACGIQAVLGSLPVKIRYRWQQALMKNKRVDGPSGWKGLLQPLESSLDELAGHADVVCLSKADAAAMGLQPDAFSIIRKASSVEVTRLGVVERCHSFETARKLSESGEVEDGIPMEEFWSTRFARLASFERSVVAVDPFAVERLVRAGMQSGLARLFQRLNSSSSGCCLGIYSQPAPEGLHSSITEMLRCLSQVAAGNLQEVTVTLVDDWYACHRAYERAKQAASPGAKANAGAAFRLHDRYLRFGPHVCWIGVGLEILEGATTRYTSFSHTSVTDTARRWENAMRASGQRSTWQRPSPSPSSGTRQHGSRADRRPPGPSGR